MKLASDPHKKQVLDDVFSAFSILAGGNIVSVTHMELGVTRFSPHAVELFGLPGEYTSDVTLNWGERIHPEDRSRYLSVMSSMRRGETLTYDLVYRIKTANGSYSVFRVVGAVLRNSEGAPSLIGGMLINEGVTNLTDPVTVLPNKHALMERLSEQMERDLPTVALLLGFQQLGRINAVHGYSYGNRVLQEVAWAIQETVGERGDVFRTNGSTFVFLTETLNRQQAAAIYDALRLRLQRGLTVDSVRQNLTLGGGMISVRGLKMDPGTVYACMNYAYRESKFHRHGELVDFNGSASYDMEESLEMVNTIRDCIVEDCRGFFIDYQPIIDIHTERTIGVEALVRWRGEPYGEVKPMEFIPILEKDFVFEELGNWIMRQVALDGLRFLEKNKDFIVSLNVSAVQFEDDYFIDSVLDTLEETGFPAKNLCVEVTKGCRLLDFARVKEIVTQLQRHDIRVVIDDFGTGFESIGFLKRLSADYIKVDRELVAGIEESEADRETVEYLARCAAIRGTSVIIKGVETTGMRDILRSYEVNCLQGNLYSKPLPFEEVLARCF